jgi:putative component of toxin-antitoxin plasmid stabilization module
VVNGKEKKVNWLIQVKTRINALEKQIKDIRKEIEESTGWEDERSLDTLGQHKKLDDTKIEILKANTRKLENYAFRKITKFEREDDRKSINLIQILKKIMRKKCLDIDTSFEIWQKQTFKYFKSSVKDQIKDKQILDKVNSSILLSKFWPPKPPNWSKSHLFNLLASKYTSTLSHSFNSLKPRPSTSNSWIFSNHSKELLKTMIFYDWRNTVKNQKSRAKIIKIRTFKAWKNVLKNKRMKIINLAKTELLEQMRMKRILKKVWDGFKHNLIFAKIESKERMVYGHTSDSEWKYDKEFFKHKARCISNLTRIYSNNLVKTQIECLDVWKQELASAKIKKQTEKANKLIHLFGKYKLS